MSKLALVLLASPAILFAQQPADSARARIDRVFAQWATTDGPGCAVGVAREGRLVHEAGYGMANLETATPITPASVFHVASVSKQFTAAAVLLLAKEGRLSLDDDIRKHLPEIPDYGHRITIRHLLTHTSGLRDQWDLLAMARGRFEENRITESDVLEIVARQKALNFAPGAEFLYSNTGYTLAAAIVKRVSGQSLRDFSEERIFRPLGMTQTQWQDDYTRVVRNRAAGYARRGDGKWHVSLPNYDTYGATSLFSTVGDLLLWQRNFDSLRVGDAALFRQMLERPVLANGDTSAYGLGLQVDEYRGQRNVNHSGGDAGYRTWLGRFPEHALDVVVLCNASTSNPVLLGRAVADADFPVALASATPPVPARVSVTREQLASMAGLYLDPNAGSLLVVTLRGTDSLVVGTGTGPLLIPIGARRFRVTGQPVDLEFTADGRLLQHVLTGSRRSAPSFRRQEQARPTRDQLAAYAGTYYSEELGATYTVTVKDSTLRFRTRWANEVTLRPAYADAFVGQYTVNFTRDGGAVDGMLMSSGRVRRVKFVKTG